MIEANVDVVEDEDVAVMKKDEVIDGRLLEQGAGRAREQGVALTGEGGLLGQSTKRVPESALAGEITDHLGYGEYGKAGEPSSTARNEIKSVA